MILARNMRDVQVAHNFSTDGCAISELTHNKVANRLIVEMECLLCMIDVVFGIEAD